MGKTGTAKNMLKTNVYPLRFGSESVQRYHVQITTKRGKGTIEWSARARDEYVIHIVSVHKLTILIKLHYCGSSRTLPSCIDSFYEGTSRCLEVRFSLLWSAITSFFTSSVKLGQTCKAQISIQLKTQHLFVLPSFPFCRITQFLEWTLTTASLPTI